MTSCKTHDRQPNTEYQEGEGKNTHNTNEWTWKYIRLVHVCRRNCARLVSLVHECHHLIIAVDNEFGEVLDVRPKTWVFTDPEVAGVLGVQEVPHLLVVDFDIGYFYGEINVGV